MTEEAPGPPRFPDARVVYDAATDALTVRADQDTDGPMSLVIRIDYPGDMVDRWAVATVVAEALRGRMDEVALTWSDLALVGRILAERSPGRRPSGE